MGDNSSSSPTTTNVDRLNSFHPECSNLKHQYDQCFNLWFTKHYMNGDYQNNECQKIFEIYTDCVKVCVRYLYLIMRFILINSINILNSVV